MVPAITHAGETGKTFLIAMGKTARGRAKTARLLHGSRTRRLLVSAVLAA
jgi:hypothetical protein